MGGVHVINRQMSKGDAMMLGRGRCREGGAEDNRSGKRNFCLAEHFSYLPIEFCNLAVAGQQDETEKHLGYSRCFN